LAKLAFEAQTLGNLKRGDDTPFDFLARLASRFAGSPIFSPGSNKSVLLDGRRLKEGQ
jgi:hypothetical protein